ncbi:MAG: carboxylating nicotinate-nucleotide diphosphorylase [Bacteroidetes bacterium]|nr:carboxylating nicotinate-nucleotide diphosphorylase [Bacteroidota bacterium]
MTSYLYLSDAVLDRLVQDALSEDLGPQWQDHTSLATIPPAQQGTARCLVKDTGILAGVDFAHRVFTKLDSSARVSVQILDGFAVKPGDVAFLVQAPVRTLLMGERLALNVMQRMSGIATATHRVVQLLEGTGCRVLDTRKTTPLVRVLEKWAVKLGGGTNHRFGLFDMILIKDNHIDAAGGIVPALEAAHEYLWAHRLEIPVEVEARTLADVQLALDFGRLDRILLDNMSLEDMRRAVQLTAKRIPLEASGNITLENARQIAETGVDFLSMGSLTHSYKSLDISLKLVTG